MGVVVPCVCGLRPGGAAGDGVGLCLGCTTSWKCCNIHEGKETGRTHCALAQSQRSLLGVALALRLVARLLMLW
jgi:hypothetical protein